MLEQSGNGAPGAEYCTAAGTMTGGRPRLVARSSDLLPYDRQPRSDADAPGVWHGAPGDERRQHGWVFPLTGAAVMGRSGWRPGKRARRSRRRSLAPYERKHVGEAKQVSDQQNQEDDDDGADHGADRALARGQLIELTGDLAHLSIRERCHTGRRLVRIHA